MYSPSEQILKKYADLLVNFALGGGKGVKKGDVVLLQVHESSKPMVVALREAVLKAGAHSIIHYIPDDIAKGFYDLANEAQLKFFPETYMRGLIDQIDHSIYMIADTNKHELEKVDPKKIMIKNLAAKPYKDWRFEKELQGKYTWTLALYGTDAMAKEVGMSLKSYWDQIIKGCYLDEKDPIAKWKSLLKENTRLKNKLNSMKIRSLHIKAKDTDLTIGLGQKRRWLGGSGRNIPSFEVFISPDWRETNGKIRFTEPLYRYGNLIKDVQLEFKNGLVTKAKASKGEKILLEMIKTTNANKIGEFSLTDSRMSRITKFMGETLFDENVGGKYGNTHIALGMAYQDSYDGDGKKFTKKDWEKLGFNDSIVHTDIIATSDRVVTASSSNGEKVIYKDGKFVI